MIPEFSISKALAVALAEHRMPRKELARKSGLSASQICTINKDNTCSLSTLVRLTEAFDVDMSVFTKYGLINA